MDRDKDKNDSIRESQDTNNNEDSNFEKDSIDENITDESVNQDAPVNFTIIDHSNDNESNIENQDSYSSDSSSQNSNDAYHDYIKETKNNESKSAIYENDIDEVEIDDEDDGINDESDSNHYSHIINTGDKNYDDEYNHTYGNGQDYYSSTAQVKSRPSFLTILLIVLLCIILSLGTSFLAFKYLNKSSSSNIGTVTKNGYTLQEATGSKLTVSEIASKNADAVVQINTESMTQDQWLRQYVTQGAGSGVIIKSDGYIMTNSHVVHGANTISVTLANGKEYPATLIGEDTENDVAVVKINASKLTTVTYGNSDESQVGDLAVVIGNPLGELGGSVASGIISSLDRDITIDDKTMNLIQTDASVNPGNSGGGMFNGDGQLVGLVVAKSGGTNIEGIGFAIPVKTAAEVAENLMKNGSTVKIDDSEEGYSGIQYAIGSDGNIYIQSLLSDTAKSSGLEVGDQVYAIEGTHMTDMDTLTNMITSHKPGEKLTYTVIRNGEKGTVKVTLGSKTKATS